MNLILAYESIKQESVCFPNYVPKNKGDLD